MFAFSNHHPRTYDTIATSDPNPSQFFLLLFIRTSNDRIARTRTCATRGVCMHARLGTGEDERPRSRRRRGWRAVDLTGNRYCCRPIARQRTRAIAAHAKALPRRVCGPLPAPICFQVICSPASLAGPGPGRSLAVAGSTLLGWGIRQFTPRRVTNLR